MAPRASKSRGSMVEQMGDSFPAPMWQIKHNCYTLRIKHFFKGKFVQINDFHYDPTYLSGDGYSCHTEIAEAGRPAYGHYDCDASWNLTESALYKVRHRYPSD